MDPSCDELTPSHERVRAGRGGVGVVSGCQGSGPVSQEVLFRR